MTLQKTEYHFSQIDFFLSEKFREMHEVNGPVRNPTL